MRLAYQGFNRAGQSVRDVIEARDAADATEVLRRGGVFLTKIVEDTADSLAGKAERGSILGKGKRLKLVAMFLRQLHVLIATGTPLAESLTALERQANDAGWKRIVGSVRDRVEQGIALSAAMSDHPAYFSPVCRGLVAAGESGGNLDAMLERLAILTRGQVHVRSSVIGAMVYPALLLVVATAVLTTLMTFVLPRFSALFASLDTPLPPTTKLLMLISDLVRGYWWCIPPLIGGVGFASWLTTRSPRGRRGMDWTAINAPQFGPIVRSFHTARICRLLGILLQGKVPLLDAIELTRDATSNSYYTRLLAGAGDAITRGDSLAGAFVDSKLVSQTVCESIRSGEKSGQLGTLLTTLADFMDEENEVTLRSLTSIIEPFILIILGVLVGFIALSMFMPLFDLTAATGGR